MIDDNKKYSLNEIRDALNGVHDVRVLNDRIAAQDREIALYRAKIDELEQSIRSENYRAETFKLYREFKDDHKSFLTRPFSDYIQDKALRARYFQDWFCQLVNYTQVENYADLMEIPEAELMKYSGVGKARIKAIKDFGHAMETGWGLNVTNLFTGSPIKKI